MKEHIAVQNRKQCLQFSPLFSVPDQNQESDQVIVYAPPPSHLIHDHDRVIIYITPPPPLVSESEHLGYPPSPLD